jgi:hypothetical protein
VADRDFFTRVFSFAPRHRKHGGKTEVPAGGSLKRGKGQTSFLDVVRSHLAEYTSPARAIAIAATRRSTFYRDIAYARAPRGFAGAITLSKYVAHSWRLRERRIFPRRKRRRGAGFWERPDRAIETRNNRFSRILGRKTRSQVHHDTCIFS